MYPALLVVSGQAAVGSVPVRDNDSVLLVAESLFGHTTTPRVLQRVADTLVGNKGPQIPVLTIHPPTSLVGVHGTGSFNELTNSVVVFPEQAFGLVQLSDNFTLGNTEVMQVKQAFTDLIHRQA